VPPKRHRREGGRLWVSQRASSHQRSLSRRSATGAKADVSGQASELQVTSEVCPAEAPQARRRTSLGKPASLKSPAKSCPHSSLSDGQHGSVRYRLGRWLIVASSTSCKASRIRNVTTLASRPTSGHGSNGITPVGHITPRNIDRGAWWYRSS